MNASMRLYTNSLAYMPRQILMPPSTEHYYNGVVCGMVDVIVRGSWYLENSGRTCSNLINGYYNMSHVVIHNGGRLESKVPSLPVNLTAQVCVHTGGILSPSIGRANGIF